MRNVPVRALPPGVILPRQEKTKAELCETMCATLRETEALFAAISSLDYAIVRHQRPLFGIHAVLQLQRTLWLHEQAHQDQIARVLTSPQFPKAA